MSTEEAKFVVVCGSTIGLLIIGWSVMRSKQMIKQSERSVNDNHSIEIAGEIDKTLRKIARIITSGRSMFLNIFHVTEVGKNKVLFRGPEGLHAMPFISTLKGEFSVEKNSLGMLRIEFRTNHGVESRAGRISLAVTLLIGLPVVAIVSVLLFAFAVPSANENIRWQSVQIIQILHTLWPPFLIQWLGRRTQRMVDDGLRQILNRLRLGL